MSNLDLVYENIKSWQEKLPPTESIIFGVMYDGQSMLRFHFKNGMTYNYVFSTQEMENAWNLDALGDMILSEADRQYRIAEVGEE